MRKLLIILLSIFLCNVFFVANELHENHIHADDTYPDTYSCTHTIASPVAGTDVACDGIMVKNSEIDSTCYAEGSVTYICRTCGNKDNYTIAKKPHNFVTTGYTSATCTEDGYLDKVCTNQNCTASTHEVLKATGHDYIETVIKKVTCLEDGEVKYKCSKGDDEYTKVIKALGHNHKETEHVDATCTEDGYIITTCKNCKDEQKQILKALGHTVEYKTTLEPTCLEEGTKTGICETCNEEVKEVIPALGHSFPEEWTTQKEPTVFSEGLKIKRCERCEELLEEAIPKKQIPAPVYGAAGGVSVGAAILLVLKKAGKLTGKKIIEETTKDAVKDIAKDVVEKEMLEPSFEEKTIVTSIPNNEFYKLLKIQKYLKIVETEYDSIAETIEEEEPVLTIIDFTNLSIEEEVDNLKSIKDELENPTISILVSVEQLKESKELLEQLKQEEVIKNYIDINTNANVSLVKIVLPSCKPDLKSDEALENIGMVADALNIPGISTLISVFVSGREAIQTYQDGKEEGLDIVDKSTIVSDIASILGLDTISSVSGLIGDLDDIKSSLEAKIGGNEVSTTKDAVEDIVDVVSDIIDKD